MVVGRDGVDDPGVPVVECRGEVDEEAVVAALADGEVLVECAQLGVGQRARDLAHAVGPEVERDHRVAGADRRLVAEGAVGEHPDDGALVEAVAQLQHRFHMAEGDDVAQVLAGNRASMRVLEKLGMVNEGVRRQHVRKDRTLKAVIAPTSIIPSTPRLSTPERSVSTSPNAANKRTVPLATPA